MSRPEDDGQGWIFPVLIMLRAKALKSPILDLEHQTMFLGYLFGFADSVKDDHRRALLNKLQFETIFGEGGDAFRQAAELASRRNPDFMRGFGFGYPDGQRFWRICDERFRCRGDQVEEIFSSLEALTALLK